MAMWVGLGMRESFAEWKTWTKRRIKQRRKDARKVMRTYNSRNALLRLMCLKA